MCFKCWCVIVCSGYYCSCVSICLNVLGVILFCVYVVV